LINKKGNKNGKNQDLDLKSHELLDTNSVPRSE